jgi:hypothetical protein
MAVLLQSLDSDESDKIVITEEMHEALSNDAFDLATISEEELVTVIEETGREVVDEDAAMDHVQDMLVEYTNLDEDDFEQRESDEDDALLLVEEEENIDMSALDEEEGDVSDEDAEDIEASEDADNADDADDTDDAEDSDDAEADENSDDTETSEDTVSADEESDVSESDETEAEVVLEDVVETEESAASEEESLDAILPGEDPQPEVNSGESVAETVPETQNNEVTSAAVDPTVQVTVEDQVPEVA